MTYPEFPPEGHHLPNREKASREIRQLNLWLPLELSTRVYELVLDKRSKVKVPLKTKDNFFLPLLDCGWLSIKLSQGARRQNKIHRF